MSKVTITKQKPAPKAKYERNLGGTATGKRNTYENSLIPGMAPDSVTKTGKAVYGEEKLETLRKNIPNPKSEDMMEAREKAISQVELLMLKGITNQSVIAQLLKIPPQTISNYVRLVHARWEVLGNPSKHNKTKGEALSKLTLIENELWTLYSNAATDSMKGKISILSQLQQVVDRKLIISGLTPRVLEAEANNVPSHFEGQLSPSDMISKHQQSVGVLVKLLGVMNGAAQGVNHDDTTVIDAEPR